MEFNDLLAQAGHDPRDVAIMLHSPANADQRRVLMALADEEPALFEAYQDNHPRSAEATLKKRPLAASFVVDDRGITAELAGRDPAGFRFSILELVAPIAPADMVIAAEGSWKRRLQTREWGLNRN